MKNLIRKVFFLLTSILLFSCSENDQIPTNTTFFNLNIGNEWVYKKYQNSFNDPTQLTFTGIVDTVKIVSIENIQGLTFAKRSSKKVNINTGTVQPITYSYVRVNNLGHLIEIKDANIGMLSETTGLVLHPGNDFSYTRNYDVGTAPNISGNVEFHLYNAINMTVEGNNYSVLPFNGLFTPVDPQLISKTVEYNYSPNIGLVKSVEQAVWGNDRYEERLVSYQLN
jgi:hypothetical protein